MKYTKQQIYETINKATTLIPNRTRYLGQKLSALESIAHQLFNTEMPLTPNQERYLVAIMDVHLSTDALKALEDWEASWATNNQVREQGDVVSQYYLSQNGWFLTAAKQVQTSLKDPSAPAPEFGLFNRMVNNEYAEKVWQSHNAEHRWKAGELVCCRANAKIINFRYRTGVDVTKEPCMVIESGSRPISNAAKYDKKRGGCRWVSINPIGTPYIYHVMEKDLKVYRIPTTKKRSKK